MSLYLLPNIRMHTDILITDGQIRELAVAESAGPSDEPEPESDGEVAHETIDAEPAVSNDKAPTESSNLIQTDPTVAYAGLTEIDAGTDVAMVNAPANGTAPSTDAPIPNADTGDSAANAAGESQWDTNNDLAASQEWVEVQKPADAPQAQAPTDAVPAPTSAAPAAAAPATSWADEEPSGSRIPTDANDGFQSVQRNRGRGNGDGFRGGRGGPGRGGRGGNSWRGDGQRSRGRGGRGGPRVGDSNGPRNGAGRAAE